MRSWRCSGAACRVVCCRSGQGPPPPAVPASCLPLPCSRCFCLASDGCPFAVHPTPAESTTNYTFPTLNDQSLDWCREWGKNCGVLSALYFCQLQGHGTVASFGGPVATTNTTTIAGPGSADRECSGDCDTFLFIECGSDSTGPGEGIAPEGGMVDLHAYIPPAALPPPCTPLWSAHPLIS